MIANSKNIKNLQKPSLSILNRDQIGRQGMLVNNITEYPIRTIY